MSPKQEQDKRVGNQDQAMYSLQLSNCIYKQMCVQEIEIENFQPCAFTYFIILSQ